MGTVWRKLRGMLGLNVIGGVLAAMSLFLFRASPAGCQPLASFQRCGEGC